MIKKSIGIPLESMDEGSNCWDRSVTFCQTMSLVPHFCLSLLYLWLLSSRKGYLVYQSTTELEEK